MCFRESSFKCAALPVEICMITLFMPCRPLLSEHLLTLLHFLLWRRNKIRKQENQKLVRFFQPDNQGFLSAQVMFGYYLCVLMYASYYISNYSAYKAGSGFAKSKSLPFRCISSDPTIHPSQNFHQNFPQISSNQLHFKALKPVFLCCRSKTKGWS